MSNNLPDFWEAAVICRDTGEDTPYWSDYWSCEATMSQTNSGGDINYRSTAIVDGYFKQMGHVIFCDDWPDYFEEDL